MIVTKEEKQLLLIDLCARLPYGVKYCRDSWNYEWDQEMSVVEVLEDIDKNGYINYHKVYKVWDIKPYLRSLSSMTEEECKELGDLPATIENVGETLPNIPYYIEVSRPEQLDWLNARHFDYRGLIEKGLALEAPKDMYKTE